MSAGAWNHFNDCRVLLCTGSVPQTPTERSLGGAVVGNLHRQLIGCNPDFLQLGGDSLQAVELLVRIEQSFGLRLDLSSILGTAPRLMQLAERIDAGGSGDYAAPRRLGATPVSNLGALLDIRPLSICDSFFDLGGDAELATTVMAEVNVQFGQNLWTKRSTTGRRSSSSPSSCAAHPTSEKARR